jgi:hypothetical protein
MRIEYEHTDTIRRYYQGISFEEDECRAHFSGSVKENLLDKEERDKQLENLRSLQAKTGFKATDQLLLDIQALENKKVSVQTFRIGEAYAEIYWKNISNAAFTGTRIEMREIQKEIKRVQI